MIFPWDVTVKATAIVLLALAGARMCTARSAAFRHWFLMAAIASAAAMPALSSVAPAWSLPDVRGGASGRAAFAPLPARASPGTPLLNAGSTPAIGATEPVQRPNTMSAVALIWAAGVLVCAGMMTVGFLRLARLAAEAEPAAEAWWAAADAWDRAHASDRSIRILQSDHPWLLATWGFVQPTIILPRGAQAWAADRIRIVVAHELAHARRGDWIAQIVAEVVRSIYWFNPVLWIACRSLRHESEHACDDAVLNDGVDATEYADELVNIARALKGGGRFRVAAPAMARSSNLARRVKVMLKSTRHRTPVTRFSRAAIAAAAITLASGVAGFDLLAQTFSTLAGSVADQTGGTLPGARLVLTRTDNGAKYEIHSDSIGRFSFVGLVSGEYELQVDLPGFGRRRAPVTVSGRAMNVDLVLEVGSLEETINVVHRAGESSAAPRRPRAGAVPAPAPCAPSGVGGQLRQPYKVADARPRYPSHLGDAGREAVVILDAVIGTDGFVRDARAVDPGVNADFLAAAIEAVQQWQFTPTLLNCTAIPVHMKITVRFRMP